MDDELGRLRIRLPREREISCQPFLHGDQTRAYWSAISRHAKDDGHAAVLAVFRKCDANNNGEITSEKFKDVLNEISPLAEDEIQALFMGADKNGNGVIEYEELIDFLFMESSDHLSTRAVLMDSACGGSLAKSGTSTTSRDSTYWIVNILSNAYCYDILLADEGGKELGWVNIHGNHENFDEIICPPVGSRSSPFYGLQEFKKYASAAEARRKLVSEAPGRASLKAERIGLEALKDMSMRELTRLWRSHGLKPCTSRDGFMNAAKDICGSLVGQVAYDPDADAVVCIGLFGDQLASTQGDFNEVTGWEMLVALAEQCEMTPSMLQLLLPSGRRFVKADHDMKVSALLGMEMK